MNAKRRSASLLLGMILAACASSPPSPAPVGSPSPRQSPQVLSTSSPAASGRTPAAVQTQVPLSPDPTVVSSGVSSPTPSDTTHAGLGVTWRALPPSEVFRGATIHAVTVRADGSFVAVGSADETPVAWTSADGVAWARHPIDAPYTPATPPGVGGFEEAATGVVAWRTGLVAIGTMTAWASPDGVTWTGVALPTSPPDTYLPAEMIAATADVVLILSRQPEVPTCGPGCGAVRETSTGMRLASANEPPDTRRVIWRSTNGHDWTASRVPGARLFGDIYDLTGDGTKFIASGYDLDSPIGPDGNPDYIPAIWTSTDGMTWSAAHRLPAARASGGLSYFAPEAGHVAPGPRGLVVIREGRTGRQVNISSADLNSWTAATLAAPRSLVNAFPAFTLWPIESAVLLVGNDWASDPVHTMILRSQGGLRWDPVYESSYTVVGGVNYAGVMGIASSRDRVVAVGNTGGDGWVAVSPADLH
jgi:hypothetical protein